MNTTHILTRDDYLAAALLEATVDTHLSNVQILVQKYRASGTTLIRSKGIATIHYAAGMKETHFGKKVIELILQEGDAENIHVQTEDGEIALHIATYWGHVEIVKLLLKHGASIDICDTDGKNAVHYAIKGGHFEIVNIFKNFAYEQKQKNKAKCNARQIDSPRKSPKGHLNASPMLSSIRTPNRIAYNFDQTSPYYINITHRNNRMKPLRDSLKCPEVAVNLFDLNVENLAEFTRRQFDDPNETSSMSMVAKWQEKVEPLRKSILENHRNSLIPEDIDEFDTIIDSFCLPSTQREYNKKVCSSKVVLDTLPPVNTSNDTFRSANCDDVLGSPRENDEYCYRMMEKYIHEDSRVGITVFEKKTLPERADSEILNKTLSAVSSILSTEVTIPLEYDTDDLRAELTQFGAPPGPISNTTKKLYMKRLMRFKKKIARMDEIAIGQPQKPVFSWELERTLQPDTWSQILAEYTAHIPRLTDSFRLQKSAREALREGHRKTSFVYLLIDPRIAENLVRDAKHAKRLEMWSTFLRSIFYVGKGKNGRPFAHLYDAIKFHRASESIPETLPLGDNQRPSSKIQRILDIWATEDKGVICLQVFRNIVPSEAFTREAAIIDAIGLSNLTNIKSGDYYGSVKAWRLRERKQLGVALLYNAMHVLLADGESQLRPDDLF